MSNNFYLDVFSNKSLGDILGSEGEYSFNIINETITNS